MESEKSTYTYKAPSEAERKEIETIRERYLDVELSPTLRKLKRLDRKVRRLAFYPSLLSGIAGITAFALGMNACLNGGNLPLGIPLSLVGILFMAVAFPIHSLLKKRLRRKYGPAILGLSRTLLEEEKEKDTLRH